MKAIRIVIVMTILCVSLPLTSQNILADSSDFTATDTDTLMSVSIVKDNEAVYVMEKISRQIPVGISTGMKYSQYSKFYNAKDYTPSLFDRYSPSGAGIASFFVPGLGHALCGEWGQAALYFVCNCICSFCWGYTLGTVVGYGEGAGWLVLSSACLLTVDIAAIVSSIQVAKVKNMYEQDVRRLSACDFKLSPYIALDPYTKTASDPNVPVIGLSLALEF